MRKIVGHIALITLLLGGIWLPLSAEAAEKFTLSSPAFKETSLIPKKYTCFGKDISPPLAWKDAPLGTQAYVLIAEDESAPVGEQVFWVLYNIPGKLTSIAEGSSPESAIEGAIGNAKPGYRGPCSPDPYRQCTFTLYALSKPLDLPSQETKQEVVKAMESHVLGKTSFTASY